MELLKIDENDLRPTRDIVFEILRKAILDGKLAQNERIMETAVAEELKISRTPVREAFRKLEAEGLVEYHPKRGTVVRSITKESIIEIYDMREVLEGLAVRLVCIKGYKVVIASLKDTVENMEKANDEGAYETLYALHDQYNKTVLEAAGSKRLKENLLNLYEYIVSFRKITLSHNQRRSISVADHKKIVDLIAEGNPEAAEEYCRKHIRKAKETLLNKLGINKD
ncbi:MAG TPA: GntR family transcriptional regulator [Clostridiales bacterium]|nr:GntR family transcriptional regulator [Clostridiales bacterium]